jgi:hypothetical protein
LAHREPDREVSSKPKVTSETITGDSRKESRGPNPIPQRYILLADDFGSRRTLASPLAGRQLPVVSAYTRAKDSLTAVRCHTRSLSQIRQSKHPAPAGFFYEPHRASKRSRAFLANGVDHETELDAAIPPKNGRT